ncbi:MAG TPA: MYXO-CTERM sorting domain-containing protein [Kofleriaceae bacterium]|nr:MYXO-CTERM sorting domain-containing protein [Kofleriaceae bacterium]
MRTTTLAAGLVLGLAANASAAVESREELVHETTTSVDLELTPETVICSHADYSATFLKVLIPQLASITLLDHQNTDAGAPCVAAGECAPFGDHAPADILDGADTSETVDITVRAIRMDDIDHDAQTCTTTLKERVDLVIRGVPFAHERYASLGTRPYGDCISSTDDGGDEPAAEEPTPDEPGDDGDKADDYGTEDPVDDEAEASDAAGCAAGGTTGSGAALALLVVGMAFGASRRRSRRAS